MHKKRAIALTPLTASLNGAVPFIVSASVPALPTVEVAAYGCSSCGAEFASAGGNFAPFCVVCGSDHVDPTEKPAQPIPEKDTETSAMKCRGCGTHNIMADITVSALGGTLHCVECGTKLDYEVEDVAVGEQPAPEKLIVDDPGKTMLPDVLTLPESKVVLNDETVIQVASAGPLNIKDVQEMQEMSLAGVIQATVANPTLAILASSDRMYALLDDVHVATLRREDVAPEHEAVFASKAFTTAVEAMAESEGSFKALAAYGFNHVKVAFPTAAAVQARVDDLVSAKTAKLESERKEIKADLMQCISLAAVALTKNLYKGRTNVLKAGMVDLLQSAGMRNPQAAVERVFASNADNYHRDLMALATELQSKPLDFRNTLSETLQEMNPVPQQSGCDLDDKGDLSGRLESAAIKPVTASVQTSRRSGGTIKSLVSAGSLF